MLEGREMGKHWAMQLSCLQAPVCLHRPGQEVPGSHPRAKDRVLAGAGSGAG